MYANVANGLKLWGNHLTMLSALALTICLPGNILIAYITATAGNELSFAAQLRLPMFVEGIFGPIYVAAVIHALEQIRLRRRVGYGEAMGVGLRLWARLFFTRFVANLLVFLGLLCLIVPGLVLAVRYALLDMAVVLDGREGAGARRRSWELTQGLGMRIVVICTIFYGLLIGASAVLYMPLEFTYERTAMTNLQYHAADVVVSCLIDVLSLAIVAILFSIHAEASGRDMEPMEPFGGAEFEPPFIAPTACPPEDGNPYRPPSAQ